MPTAIVAEVNNNNNNNNNDRGTLVTANGTQSFVCKRSPGRTGRHHALNDLVARAFASAGLPVTKEPHGLTRSDGKRPDGLTMVPCKEEGSRKPLTWDVTVVCPVADSYVDASARDAGLAAELTGLYKVEKYRALEWTGLSSSNLSLLNLYI